MRLSNWSVENAVAQLLMIPDFIENREGLSKEELVHHDLSKLYNSAQSCLQFVVRYNCADDSIIIFWLLYKDQNCMEKGYSALIYGSTGAVGRELVEALLNSDKWQKVHVVVRRELPEWSQHPKKVKLQVQLLKDMESLLIPKNFTYKGFDSLFCCLGSQTKHGQETFVKVDKTYPLCAADIALKNNIPHYLFVSSVGADEKSWFLYPRTKGQVQNQLKKKKLPLLSIFRPGLLVDRSGARPVEKVASFLPFFPKIQAKDAALVLMKAAERDIQKAHKAVGQAQLFQNKEMLNILKN